MRMEFTFDVKDLTSCGNSKEDNIFKSCDSLTRPLSVPDPPENCHLTVKKLPKT